MNRLRKRRSRIAPVRQHQPDGFRIQTHHLIEELGFIGPTGVRNHNVKRFQCKRPECQVDSSYRNEVPLVVEQNEAAPKTIRRIWLLVDEKNSPGPAGVFKHVASTPLIACGCRTLRTPGTLDSTRETPLLRRSD